MFFRKSRKNVQSISTLEIGGSHVCVENDNLFTLESVPVTPSTKHYIRVSITIRLSKRYLLGAQYIIVPLTIENFP